MITWLGVGLCVILAGAELSEIKISSSVLAFVSSSFGVSLQTSLKKRTFQGRSAVKVKK